jgi:hypothetical protein
MKDYVAAQYCMSCVDQTFNYVLDIPEVGPPTFKNYFNKFTDSTFAKYFE